MSGDSLPGESGKQVYDGEYLLRSAKIGGRAQVAPELRLILQSEDNSLCPSNYDPDTVCVSAGSLSVVFRAEGKNFPISISDHDLRPTPLTHDNYMSGPQWTTFSDDEYMYRIIGVASRVENRSRDKTYLRYRVTRAKLFQG